MSLGWELNGRVSISNEFVVPHFGDDELLYGRFKPCEIEDMKVLPSALKPDESVVGQFEIA